MTTRQLTKFQTAEIAPPAVRPAWEKWKGKDVYISADEHEILIRKIDAPDFWKLRERLQNAEKPFSPAELEEAIAHARSRSQNSS